MQRGVAQSTAGTRWTNGIVPYVMSPNFTVQQQALITGAMRNIERLTTINNRKCVQFRPKVGQNTGWRGQLQLTLQVPTSPTSSH
ncbi:unnamed protein product, partial [Rotaria sordida]